MSYFIVQLKTQNWNVDGPTFGPDAQMSSRK